MVLGEILLLLLLLSLFTLCLASKGEIFMRVEVVSFVNASG